jgi:hypothetical protein
LEQTASGDGSVVTPHTNSVNLKLRRFAVFGVGWKRIPPEKPNSSLRGRSEFHVTAFFVHPPSPGYGGQGAAMIRRTWAAFSFSSSRPFTFIFWV